MRYLVFIWCMLVSSWTYAQGYDIEVDLEHYQDSTIMLGYHLGKSQYIQDTISRSSDGIFRIKGEESLIPGIYLLVLQPNNTYVEILVEEDQSSMKIWMDAKSTVKSFKVEGSEANTEFYAYLNYLEKYQSQITDLKLQVADTTQVAESLLAEEKITSLKNEVLQGQKQWIEKNPDGFVSAIIRANMPLDLPEFDGTEEEKNTKRWRYYQNHYFDQVSLSDVRLLRTPILLTRIEYYLDKLVIQHPDSIMEAADMILDQMSSHDEVYKFGVSYILNKYAASKIVGMDAIYVHMIDTYYNTGKTPWVSKENIAKMAKQAAKIKPLLIGKIAPNFKVYKQDRTPIALHEIESDFTVLFFWAPDCGHCKKSMPTMIQFYEDYKDKGVELMAVCTKSRDKEPACWEMVAEKGMDIWVNASDKDLVSRFQLTYDIKSTPQIYILDSNKKILMKRIGSDQLGSVMDQLLIITPVSK